MSYRFVRNLLWFLTIAISPLSPVKAQNTAQWAVVGNWSIRIGLQPFAQAKECFLITSTQDGSLFRLGFAGRGIYISIGNPAWQSVQIGSTYALSVKFGDKSPWAVRAQAIASADGGKVLLTRFDEQSAFQILAQFAEQGNVLVYYKDKLVISVPLVESRAAATAMFDCESKFAPPIRN